MFVFEIGFIMNYQTPEFLKERYSSFEDRWNLRDQFEKIIQLLQNDKTKLEILIQKNISKKKQAQNIIKDIDEFRVWSWKEADRDEFFYNEVEKFDKETFILLYSD